MECHCIPAGELPQATRLFTSYLQDFSQVSDFYAHRPNVEAVRQVARDLKPNLEMRRQVAEVLRGQNRLFGGDEAVEKALNAFAEGAAAVVSGQQVGLFLGPSYTIYKALSAIRLADELARSGTPAVPIFWLATEDHDLAEVNHSLWPAREELRRLELPVDGSAGRRVGEVRLGDAVGELVEHATAMLAGPIAEDVAAALAESYRPDETYGSAFGKLLTRLFAGRGLILIDPRSPELHRLTSRVYCEALAQSAELRQELQARGAALEKARFHVQVKVADSSTLLFMDLNGERLPLRARSDGFVAGRSTFTLQKLLEIAEISPEVFSPNVLLRPVIQDTLLDSVAYVAGPAEIAYFAQGAVVYDRLLHRMPVIIPRASFTLVDSHALRLLRKYNLNFSDLLQGRQFLRTKLERDLMPRALTRRFEAGERALRKMLEDLREPVAKLDPTLNGSLTTAQEKMIYQFTNLRGKVGHAVAFRSSVLDGHEKELVARLYPGGGLQERSVCFLPMLASYGAGLLDELLDRIVPGSAQHHVLYL
jgi:bacillithiol biosynthesis cysteine-adding enzyme BshC